MHQVLFSQCLCDWRANAVFEKLQKPSATRLLNLENVCSHGDYANVFYEFLKFYYKFCYISWKSFNFFTSKDEDYRRVEIKYKIEDGKWKLLCCI